MTYYQISETIDAYYNKMTRKVKVWTFIAIAAMILLLLFSIGFAIYYNYQRHSAIAKYEQELEKSKQNYYLETISNSNLEKKLQELNLRLAELINNTVTLEEMISQMDSEKYNLEEIRQQLESGVRNTKVQLDKMQSSVNSLINQRSKDVIYRQETIIYEKSDTHGK